MLTKESLEGRPLCTGLVTVEIAGFGGQIAPTMRFDDQTTEDTLTSNVEMKIIYIYHLNL